MVPYYLLLEYHLQYNLTYLGSLEFYNKLGFPFCKTDQMQKKLSNFALYDFY